jgi:uncharacterized protein YqfA (UPF0365 family)
MNPWNAYLLGVGTTLALLLILWMGLRIAEPWIMARAAAIPIGFPHILGMRLRKTDPAVVVGALVVLTKADQPIQPLQLEALYMTLPERQRSVDDLVKAARESMATIRQERPTV